MCQQARKFGLSKVRQDGTQTVDMGLQVVSVTLGHACDHSGKCPGGPALHEKATFRELEAATSSGGGDLAPLQQSSSQPVCLK